MDENQKSPILGTWKNVYALVIGVLVAIIISLYLFTEHYQ
ncbi:MAG: hypothetical protein K0R26_2117 [Bacteroidota bacterium]|jgi:hypothetical protein|nr:hypothetical protein [Bacteroidota bacterium]